MTTSMNIKGVLRRSKIRLKESLISNKVILVSRIFMRKLLLRKVLKETSIPTSSSLSSSQRVFVPLIETSHYQIHQVLLVAKALTLRGASVNVLVCNGFLPACEVRSSRNSGPDACASCKMHYQILLHEYGLNYTELSDLLPPSSIDAIRRRALSIVKGDIKNAENLPANIDRIVNDSVTRYFYGDPPDISSDTYKQAQIRYFTSALLGFEAAKRAFQKWEPTLIFNNMDVYVDWAPYFEFFKGKGVRAATIAMSQFNYKAVLLNQHELYLSNERYLNWKELNGPLSPSQGAEISAFIQERFSGRAAVFQNYGFFERRDSPRDMLGINPEKRNIFLFSNVYWDVGMSEFGRLFPGVIEWVLETIKEVANEEGCHLYIKPHPSEVFEIASKGVLRAIFEEYPVLPSNVSIVHAELKILTYDLFEFIDLGVVYNGTLGLEMCYEGIPVIACGKTPYGDIGIVAEPEDTIQYRNLLLGSKALSFPNKEKVLSFCYFYFIKTLLPWSLTESVYGDESRKLRMQSVEDLEPGKNKLLDHLCDVVMGKKLKDMDFWEQEDEDSGSLFEP